MNQKQLIELQQYLETAELALAQAKNLAAALGGDEKSLQKVAKNKARLLSSHPNSESGSKIVEGIFNGQTMIDGEGKEYSIPANYASKSKLVAGDSMKLTIQPDGTFIYKQTKPIDRDRLTGTIMTDEDDFAVISADGRKFKVLTASVTYFKGSPGDHAIILIPKNYPSSWAAIENIIKKEEWHENEPTETPLIEQAPTTEAAHEILPPVKTDLLATEEQSVLPAEAPSTPPLVDELDKDLNTAHDDLEDL